LDNDEQDEENESTDTKEPSIEELSSKLISLKKSKKKSALRGKIKIKKPVLAKKFVNLMEDLAGRLAVNKLSVAEEFVKKLKKQKEEEVYQSIGVTRSLKNTSNNKKGKHGSRTKKHSIKSYKKLNSVVVDTWNLKNTKI